MQLNGPLPSVVVVLLVAVCWLVLPRPERADVPPASGLDNDRSSRPDARAPRATLRRIFGLFRERKFVVVVALSFALTLLRETFNFWTVDFIRTEGGVKVSSAVAAFLSTPFDLCGAAGIVLMGWVFGRLQSTGRQRLLVVILGLLSLLLAALPELFHLGTWVLATGVGAIGFLVYGPYSLLGGVLSVEVRGKEFAATVSGLVDGTGYVAGFLSGIFFGKLLMHGGYRLGFQAMAALTLISAILCYFLYRNPAAMTARAAPLPSPAEAVSDSD